MNGRTRVIFVTKHLLLRAMLLHIGMYTGYHFIYVRLDFLFPLIFNRLFRWSHVSEKPLSCDRCSMTFTSKAQFAVHIRSHSGAQNYECNICGRTFIRDSYLIRYEILEF